VVTEALSTQDVTDGVAKKICHWTGILPDDHVDMADRVLLTAFAGGAKVADLADLAAQIAALVMGPSQDEGKEPGRGVRLERTFGGAGVLTGDLDPAVAAVLQAALDLYGPKLGKDDLRSAGERYHDALGALCRDALAGAPGASAAGSAAVGTGGATGTDDGADMAGGEFGAGDSTAGSGAGGGTAGGTGAGRRRKRRRGKAGAALVHINLADVAGLGGYGEVSEAWRREAAAQWAGHSARASVEQGDGGTWLSGEHARGFLPECRITPVVTGRIDPDAIRGWPRRGTGCTCTSRTMTGAGRPGSRGRAWSGTCWVR